MKYEIDSRFTLVAEDVFKRVLYQLNVHPRPVGEYPYDTEWISLSTGEALGVENTGEGVYLIRHDMTSDNQRTR